MREAKNRDIEILRAIAIAFVMFFHLAPHALARLPGIGSRLSDYTGLWSGVDLFFCVSGFVITQSLLRESPMTSGFAAFAFPFWTRRIFRLWPGAWLWAFVAVGLSYGFNSLGLFGVPEDTLRDAAMAVANLANVHDFFCLRDRTCGALRIYWSLSLEEQFYWILPLLVFFLSRRVLIGLLCLATVAQVFLVRPMAFMTDAPSLAWLFRTDAVCLGALTALASRTAAYRALQATLTRHRIAAALVVFMLLAVLACVAAPALHIARATGVLAVTSALLVGIASCDATFIIPRLAPLEPALLWMGSRSYSLYLVHDIGGALAAEIRTRLAMSSGLVFAVFGLGLTGAVILVLAEINFRWVEAPLRRYGRGVAAGMAH